MNIAVITDSEDKLRREVWTFMYLTGRHELVLATYSFDERPTRRHNYRLVVASYRLGVRLSDSRTKKIAIGDAPLPESVKAEARRQFCELLVVKAG